MIYVVENEEEKRKKKVFSIVSQSGQRGKLYLSSLSDWKQSDSGKDLHEKLFLTQYLK